jgi:hypothetical protein
LQNDCIRGFTSVIKLLTVPSQVMVVPPVSELLLLQDKMKNTEANTDKNKCIFFINEGF